jgi:hypothetical protein
VPNTAVSDVRIVVRAANQVPQFIALAATGATLDGDPLAGAVSTVTGDEGTPLAIELSARDADFDLLHWSVVGGLPAGMTLEPIAGSNGQARLVLRWTPGLFAAQSDNTQGRNAGPLPPDPARHRRQQHGHARDRPGGAQPQPSTAPAADAAATGAGRPDVRLHHVGGRCRQRRDPPVAGA